MVLKKIERAATTSWSPASESEPLLALGTAAGALDASFSSKTVLEVFGLNLVEPNKKLKKLAEVSCNARFNRISWQKDFIACGKENGEIDIWDPKKILSNAGEKALKLRAKNHSGPVRGLDVNLIDSNLLASGAAEGEILIWDMNQPNQPYAPGAKSQRLEDVTCLAWNKQVGHILACGSSNGYTVVWDLRNRRELISIPYPGGRKPVTCISWNPDNPTQMVTCNDDDADPVILMWDLRNASAAEKTFSGHSKGIMSMDWCPKDSGILLSGGKDNRTIVWDAIAGHPIGDLAHSSNWTFDTKWCPRNPDLCVVASFDGMVTLHSLQGSSDHPEEDAFSPAPAHADPYINDPNDPFSQIGVQHHQQRKMTQPIFSLPHPPKWLRRPAGAVWGFGGKLAVFGTNHGTVVSVKTIPISDEIAFRADQLDYILKENNPETSAQYCDYMANSEFIHNSKEKDFWNFLKGLFSSGEHIDMSGFLNYDPSFSKEERLSKLMKKLNLSLESDSPKDGALSPDSEKSKTLPFALYSSVNTEDSDIDVLVTKAVSVGNFENAVNICLGANRMADALVLALSGSPELLEKVQHSYFKKHSGSRPYIRVLKAVAEGNLTDIISNAKLDTNNAWRDLIALISTYSRREDLTKYFSILGKRIIDPASGLKDIAAQSNAAALCFAGSGELEKVVGIMCEPKKGTISPNDVELQSLAERLSVLRQAINYEDPELILDNTSEGSNSLHNLYDIYVKYAWLATVQGNLGVAWRFLEQVPVNFMSNDFDITVLRERVYASQGLVLAATGKPPAFPFEYEDVVDQGARQQQIEAARILDQQYYNSQNQQIPPQNQWQPPAPNSNNWQVPAPSAGTSYTQPWGNQQTPFPNQWQNTPNVVASPPPVSRNQIPYSSLPSSTYSQRPPQNSASAGLNQQNGQYTPATLHSTGHATSQPFAHYPPPPQNISQTNPAYTPPPTYNQWQPNSASAGSNQQNGQYTPATLPSTGHAPPQPFVHYQPPPVSRSNSITSPPVTSPPNPPRNDPDRSGITNPADKACYSSLVNLWAELKASSKNIDKKLIEEAEKKLEVLYDQMNLRKIPAPIISDLQAICNALTKQEFLTAKRIQNDLMTKKFDTTGSWIIGVKRLIDGMERNVKSVHSPPVSRTPSFTSPSHASAGLYSQSPQPSNPALFSPPPIASWNSSLDHNTNQGIMAAPPVSNGAQHSHPGFHQGPPPISGPPQGYMHPQTTAPPAISGPPPISGPPQGYRAPQATAPPAVSGPPPISGPPSAYRPPQTTAPPSVSGPPPIPGPHMAYRPPPNAMSVPSPVSRPVPKPGPTQISSPPVSSALNQNGPTQPSSRPPFNAMSDANRHTHSNVQQVRPNAPASHQFRPPPSTANIQRPPFRNQPR